MTIADVQAIVSRSAYLSWLGLQVIEFGEAGVTARASWREEWVANPMRGQTHGGIIAALLDFAASFALAGKLGQPAISIDIRIDFLRLAKRGDLTVSGKILKLGRQVSTCEALLHDETGRLIASGRGTFLSATDSADEKSPATSAGNAAREGVNQ